MTALPYSKKHRCEASVDASQALGYLGYAQQTIDEHLMARFEAQAKACERDSMCLACWATFPIDADASTWLGSNRTQPRVVLEQGPLGQNPPILEGASINQHLRGATHAVFLAVTAGLRNEAALVRLNATSPTDAMLYSAAGSSLAESAADAAEAVIRQQAHACGLSANWRFSPGYGDFPLTVQPSFLACLDAPRSLGLTATVTNLLVPTKSITAILGLFEGEAPSNPPNPCNDCLLRTTCTLKEKGTTCHGQ